MSFTLPDIDINSWTDYQKRELQRQMDEKVQSFGLGQAINEKMSGLQEIAGGVQETFGGAVAGATEAVGSVAPAVGAAADSQMQQVQAALAATQPTFDQPSTAVTQPARMPEPPPEMFGPTPPAQMPEPPPEMFGPDRPAPMPGYPGAQDDQQRQVQEALERTRPQLQAPTTVESAAPDQMRQIQDMLGQTGRAVSEQLSRFTPSPSASPGVLTTPGGASPGVNPQPTPAEVRAYITEAAAARGIDPNIALRVANSEGGFEAARRGTFKTGSSWWPFQLHYGGAGYEHLGTEAGMGNSFTKETGYEPGDPNAWQAATDYALDRAKKGGWGAWYGAKAQGIEGFAGIDRSAKDVVGERVQGAYKDVSQFGDSMLSAGEAAAACGPAAAVRFAQRFGRNPSLKEALDLAKDVGWTAQQGMAGIASEHKLLEKLGVPSQLVMGRNWDLVTQEAQTGNPVTISTAKHYFSIDDYDPKTNKYHVGSSGSDLRGGSDWMSAQQMEAALGGGTMQGALLANSPTVPRDTTAVPGRSATDQQIASAQAPRGESVLEQLQRASEEHTTRGRAWLDEQTRNLEQAVSAAGAAAGQDLSATNRPTPMDVQSAPLSTGAVEAVQAGALEAPARAVLQSPLTPWGAADALSQVGKSGVGEFYKSLPTPIESVETMANLTEKYPSGTVGVPNLSAMTPEDRAVWNENSLNVGTSVESPRVGGVVGRMGAGAQRLREAALARGASEVRPPATSEGVISDLGQQQRELAELMESLTPLEERIARLAGDAPVERVAEEASQARRVAGSPSFDELAQTLPTTGRPGISVEPYVDPVTGGRPEIMRNVVYRDADGNPQGVLQMFLDVDGKPSNLFVAVDPAQQRQGIGTALYDAAKKAGYDVDAATGKSGYTEAGEAFARSRAGAAEAPPSTGGGGVGGGGIPPSAADATGGVGDSLLRRFAPELGSAVAGGIAGWETSEDLPIEERIARTAAGLGIGAGVGATGVRRYLGAVEKLPQIGENIPKQSTGFIDEVEAKTPPMPSGWDYALSGSYFNLLSALPTHIRNVVGGALTTATSPIEKLGAAAFDPAARAAMRWVDPEGAQKGLHSQRERYFGEVPADVFGMLTSLPMGLRNAVKRYADEITPEDIALERARPEVFKDVPGLKHINSPGKMLRAEDGFFSTLNEYQAAYSMAYRQAQQEGVKGLQNQADRITDIIRNPSEKFLKEVQRQGKYRTFQQEGGIADSVARLRDKAPGSKLVVPFVRTPINMTKFVLERSPVGLVGVGKDILAAKVHKGTREALLNKPGGAAGDLADRMSRATMGSVAMGGLYAWAQGGNLTGKAPTDEAERDAFYRQGKQEYSFKSPINGEWYSYKAMMPFSPIIATAADMVQLQKEKPDQDLTGVMTLAAATFGQNMIDTQWTRTFVDVIDVMSGRGPGGDDPAKKANALVEKLAAANIPGGSMTRSLARALDNTMYNPENPLEAMSANIPGTQGLAAQFPEQLGGLAVKPKLDAFGRERKYPQEGLEALMDVFPSTKPTEDPVELELKRLQTGPEGEPRYDVQPGFVSNRVTAFEQQVELEPAQQQWYQQQSGQLSYAMLQLVVGTPEWRAMNDEEKTEAVDRIVSRSREAMRTQMEATLFPQALTEMVESQRRLRVGAEPTTEPLPTPAPTPTPGGSIGGSSGYESRPITPSQSGSPTYESRPIIRER